MDAAFHVNANVTSQLGIVPMLRNNDTGEINGVHYASFKSKRVCKSVLAAELFALVGGYDIGCSLRDTVGTSHES